MVAMMALGMTQAACGDDEALLNENLVIENVAPMGSVGGQVLTAEDDRPLANAAVNVVTGDFNVSTTTDGSGFFSISEVPASGTVLVLVEGAGMLSAETTKTFTPAAGDYAMSNATLTIGPIGLEPSSGTFALWVYDENGRPAAGHVISLTTSTRWMEYLSGTPVDRGAVTVFATVGSNGLATFTDLPDFWALGGKASDQVVITVPPYDADVDGYFEFPGGVYTYNVLALSNPQPTLLLQTDGNYPSSLSIVASNIAGLEGWNTTTYIPDTIDPVGPITVLFNMPVQQDTLSVEVYAEDGIASFGSSYTLDGRSLTIQFPTALPTDISGAEYNMLISAVAETGDRLLYGGFNAAFFVLDPANTDGVTATVAKEEPGNLLNLTTIVTFSEPVGFGAPGTALSGSNCVLYFGVYNLGPNGTTGDDPGEYGYGSCPFTFSPREPSPEHPAGATLSGYSSTWVFQMPILDGGGTMPSGIPLYLAFDMVSASNRIMRRANGQAVPDIEIATP